MAETEYTASDQGMAYILDFISHTHFNSLSTIVLTPWRSRLYETRFTHSSWKRRRNRRLQMRRLNRYYGVVIFGVATFTLCSASASTLWTTPTCALVMVKTNGLDTRPSGIITVTVAVLI